MSQSKFRTTSAEGRLTLNVRFNVHQAHIYVSKEIPISLVSIQANVIPMKCAKPICSWNKTMCILRQENGRECKELPLDECAIMVVM
ncbi:hypothetical protein AVEN_240308-1 [Araneus ventricosus]|uniref:Uncharacterized protein n=1 Tax=Araneus ventricosus TaxID=182803 RepID=A0A4Y2FLQ7_ARAVE|nr:hypothetical protein AVEN_240308-1 [Araneus ventricosus]